MLRSSGFFRGVECPFGPACGRPYCHFRHPAGPPQAAAPPTATLPRRRRGCGYDPYNPELPKPVAQSSNGALEEIPEPAAGILELELVNKAIEAAKDEYERDRKKYEELLETAKEYGSSEGALLDSEAASDPFPSLDYNPGSYDACCSTDYNPTPLSGKYTLDSSGPSKSKGRSLEYVPTVVSHPKKYSSSAGNSKYVVDNSKPSTDLEYDPLSNYSARLLNKAKQQKGVKRKRGSDHSEVYSPSLKRVCDASSDSEPSARFSDSEEERDAGHSSSSKINCVAESGFGAGGARQAGSQDKVPKRSEVSSREDPKVGAKSKGGTKEKPRKKREEGKTDGSKVTPKEKAKLRNGERVKEKTNKAHKPMSPGAARVQDGGKKTRGEKSNGGKKDGEKADVGKKNEEKVDVGKKDGKLRSADPKRKTDPKDGKGKRPSSDKPKLGNSEGKRRTLSHAELFGDESGDEGSLPVAIPGASSDSDADGGCSPLPRDNGVVGAKRPKLSKRPSSSSSSSDEVDYSVLERDLDFESDPMEECLRIFNESTDVKTEDKGRLGKQPSKEEGAEEKATEDRLTTLFPGQKRRISHVANQASPAKAPRKTVVRPFRPPTAQEVCYQRIQEAQKQALRLAQQQQQQQQRRQGLNPNCAAQQQQQQRSPACRAKTGLGARKGGSGSYLSKRPIQ
nr:PREDICTED: RNA exonuclease 1 homolog [Anolis carolinensis]|eukprot:XP_008102929.1 PREDICTED: RNA exonuclease 1 homolog [Anolis carolinensis]